MFRNYFYNFIYLSIFLCCSVVLADEAEVYASALVLDKDGNPIEGREMQVILQDETNIAISSDSFITNKTGYIHFTIIGKHPGDAVVMVSDPPEQLCRAGGI